MSDVVSFDVGSSCLTQTRGTAASHSPFFLLFFVVFVQFSYAFQMQGLTSAAAANSCQVYAKTQAVKTEWVEHIQKAV